MLKLSAKIRSEKGKDKGILPGVLYGPKIKNVSIEMGLKDFKKVFEKAGESSLISLDVKDGDKEKNFPVLVHDIQRSPVTDEIIHVDFYQPILTEEVEVTIPVIFEGESPAVKDLGGTLVKEIQELTVKALPEKLPHEIKVDISLMVNIKDEILIKDLNIPSDVKILKDAEDIVAVIAAPTKVEEELEKPIEEKVEEVERVEKPEKEEEVPAEEQPKEENK